MNKKSITIGPEKLITTRGTIIPRGLRFDTGDVLVSYHIDRDAPFSPSGASLRRQGSDKWIDFPVPTQRTMAEGLIGKNRAVFLTPNMFQKAPGEYALLYGEIENAAESLEAITKTATFYINGVEKEEYQPRPKDDSDYWYRREIPEYYSSIAAPEGAVLGPRLFGTVIRLPDGALGVCGFASLKGNLTRPALRGYIPPPKGVDEPEMQTLRSALFFRSEDEGLTWHGHVIASPRPERPDVPFGVGLLSSQGFTETDVAVTADGTLLALMRQGHYMHLYWSRSSDGGRTWSDFQMFNYPGVAPALCMMPCGTLAAAWGRPGITVAFDTDGTGEKWNLMSNFDKPFPSQEYTSLVSVGEKTVWLFYDRRKWDQKSRRFYEHGIYYREITIET